MTMSLRCCSVLWLLLLWTVHGIVEPLTISRFEEITAHHTAPIADNSGNSGLWIVRFHLPWETAADATQKGAAEVFSALSDEVPSCVARFGEFAVDSRDTMALIDGLFIEDLPAIRSFGGRVGRPAVLKGAPISARPWYFERQDFTGNHTEKDDLFWYLLSQIPTRYVDPLTNKVRNSMLTVNSLEEISKFRGDEKIDEAVPAAIVFTRDTKFSPLLLGTWYAQGAAFGGRIQLFVSTEETLAQHFGVSVLPSESFTAVVLSEELDAPSAVVSGLADVTAISSFMSDHAAPAAPLAEKYAKSLSKWREDISLFFTASPLRKIEADEHFMWDVAESKTASIIFFLRETDRSFEKYFKIAVEVAQFALRSVTTSPVTGEPLQGVPRPDVFWIDAESHSSVAKAFRLVNVPTVCFILPLQNGKLGSKFMPEWTKKDDLPSANMIIKYLVSSQLMEGKGVVEVDPKSVKFSTVKPGTEPNRQHLILDMLDYSTDTDEHNLLMQFRRDKATAAAVEEESDVPRNVKRTPEQERKKKKKEEKRKAALKEEMDRKKREKEERIRKKAEEAEAEKKRKAEELKNRPKTKKKNVKLPPSPDEERINEAKKRLQEQAKKPPKPPLDPAALKKIWQADGERAAREFIELKGGEVNIIDRLDL